jgi:3-phosphoshikimate 1-carboxyvinyltransferase
VDTRPAAPAAPAAPAVATVTAGAILSGRLRAPASKSVTNRLLVMAALAEGTSHLRRPLVSDDTAAMASGLRALGVEASLDADQSVVVGRAGVVGPPTGVVGAGLSGTTLRFLAAMSLLCPEPVTLDGLPPLRRRPLGPLIAALERAGAAVTSDAGHPPVTIRSGGLEGGRLSVDAAASSQFATALLLVAPYARVDVELEVVNLGAGGYVELTVEAMRRFGVRVATGPRANTWSVPAGQCYVARDEEVEYDASAAAHLFALGIATGGAVTVENAGATCQPDAGIVEVFEQLGARVSRSADGSLTVAAGDHSLQPVDVDLATMPDQVATIATLAALAPGTSTLRGLGVVRGHETDRLAAVAAELTRLGGDVRVEGDGLVVHGGRPLRGAAVETYHDHRMAMAFTALAAVVPGVSIVDPGCVAKTYPAWWEDAAALGLELSIT